MSETTGTPELNAALAKLQAGLPRVSKGETAKVPGKEGKTGYSYKYADLADISATVLPLLGKLGLAWTAQPTMRDGAFILHYKLRHTSGELDEGFYPLPSPERTGPQQVGSAITYARRYCLCAVTGIHPDGEDDDGAAAQHQTAGSAWENATPARNGHARQGRSAEEEHDAKVWLEAAGAAAQIFTDDAAGQKLWAQIIAKRDGSVITPADAAHLQNLVRARWKELTDGAPATDPRMLPADDADADAEQVPA